MSSFILDDKDRIFTNLYGFQPWNLKSAQARGDWDDTRSLMLRGSDDVMAACKAKGLKKGGTTEDGLFTLSEVECLGACANAPMVQINDDNYEDLTFETTTAILEALARGETPQPGPQIDRQTSCPEGGPTSLPEMVGENHDYRPSWGEGAQA